MAEKIINAGDEVDSYCTSCKLMLAHRVVALVDGKPEKVVCKTCNRKHKYRPNLPKSRQKKTTGTKKRKTRSRRKDPALIWEEALTGKENVEAKTYAMDGIFLQDDVIEHAKFGRGLVREIQAEGKMEVLFQDGPKLLVYGRT